MSITENCLICRKEFQTKHLDGFFCSQKCYREAQKTDWYFQERFWSKVEKNGPTPAHCPEVGQCWMWEGGFGTSGYGKSYRFGKLIYAHRAAYMIENGSEGMDGMFVCHKCDNQKCVRPAHLFLATQKENIQDCIRKGRSRNQFSETRVQRWAAL